MLFNKFSVTQYILTNSNIVNDNMLNVNNMLITCLPKFYCDSVRIIKLPNFFSPDI